MTPVPVHGKSYSIEDIYSLPEGSRAELIDEQIYYMAPPSRKHQNILSFFHLTIGNYIAGNNGECKVYQPLLRSSCLQTIPSIWSRTYP